MKRKVIFHSGPTNSGKTYAALERLKAADKGLYCAPLRMMAWEVYDKILDSGIPCNLITGQLKLRDRFASHSSITVECANQFFNQVYDVAIIVHFSLLKRIG